MVAEFTKPPMRGTGSIHLRRFGRDFHLFGDRSHGQREVHRDVGADGDDDAAPHFGLEAGSGDA